MINVPVHIAILKDRADNADDWMRYLDLTTRRKIRNTLSGFFRTHGAPVAVSSLNLGYQLMHTTDGYQFWAYVTNFIFSFPDEPTGEPFHLRNLSQLPIPQEIPHE